MWGFLRSLIPERPLDGNKPDIESSRDAMELQLQSIEWFAIRFLSIMAIAIVGYGISVHSEGDEPYWWRSLYVFAIFTAIGVTGIVSGGLLGFIFGIPRFLRQTTDQTGVGGGNSASRQATPNADGQRALRSFAGNTNLEEISDWLTKIMVGLGLTQASAIYTGVSNLAVSFQNGAMKGVLGANAFFLAISLSALAGGFLFFYLETRTRITLLLSDADIAAAPLFVDKKLINISLDSPIQPDSSPLGGTQPIVSPTSVEADKKLLSLPFESLQSADALAAWAGAQARANNHQAALRAIQEAVTREPDNKQYLMMMANIRLRQGNPQAAVDIYSEARSKLPADPALLRQEILAALYLPPPGGFQHALETAVSLFAIDPDAANDPMVQVWLAAAYGQQYTWLSRNNGTNEEKIKARQLALEAVRAIIKLQPAPNGPARSLLRQIFDPALGGEVSGNDDLHIFSTDSEFRDLIIGNQVDEGPITRLPA